MRIRFAFLLVAAFWTTGAIAPASADPAFDKFVQSLWPQAQQIGVSRKTFDAATRGIEPDLSLPDLDIPGRVEKPPAQPEFVQTPAAYVSETTIARYAAQGKKLAAEHRDTLARIERDYGMPGNIILAIWARETAFGGYKLPHSAMRVLATQAYLGRRKDQFRQEFLQALKILEEGHVKLHAVDFDGDGRRDIWSSIPDALASAASQLVGRGWQRGRRWAHEVRVPANFDCTKAEPGFTLLVREWVKQGFAPAYGRKLSETDLAEQASLLMPEGSYGPAFLAPKNYFVLKDYNFSDLYVLFVGHLSDRISDSRPFETPWSKADQLRTAQVEEMQRILAAKGIYKDKVDGKAGMLTRAALGDYQKANGLKLDCWPTPAVLEHMRGRAAKNR